MCRGVRRWWGGVGRRWRHRRQTSRGTRIGAGCGIPDRGRGLDLAERPLVDGMLSGDRVVRSQITRGDRVVRSLRQAANVLKLRCGKGRWRTTAPYAMNAWRVNWERLKEEEKKEEFVRKAVELMEESGELGKRELWKKLTGLMTCEAEEVC